MSQPTITVTELNKIITDQANAQVIDVRTPLEYSEVHVKEATLIPLDELDPSQLSLDKEQAVYILCRSGGRAAKAAAQLAAAGYQQAIVVEGGTLAWLEAGLPAERSGKKVVSLERQVRIAAGSLVLLGVILSYLVHPSFIFLSGFVGAGLIFAGITDWCGLGLLIAKAPWNQSASCCATRQ